MRISRKFWVYSLRRRSFGWSGRYPVYMSDSVDGDPTEEKGHTRGPVSGTPRTPGCLDRRHL